MSKSLQFFVEGVPAPGGSKTVFPIYKKGSDRPVMVKRGEKWWPLFNITDDAGERNKEWRKAVGFAAKEKMRGNRPVTGAVLGHFIFHMKRPKAHFRSNGTLRPDAPLHHIQKPDALKLARSTEDAMTGIVYADDAQTITISASKIWSLDKSGCMVTFTRAEDPQPNLPINPTEQPNDNPTQHEQENIQKETKRTTRTRRDERPGS